MSPPPKVQRSQPILFCSWYFIPLGHSFCSTHFCSALDFLHLNWGIFTIQNSKVPINFYSARSHNFCPAHFGSTLTFLHLNWGVSSTQSPKVPTNFILLMIFYSAGSQFLFYSFLFCFDLFALKLGGLYHLKSEGPNRFLFHWFLFCWVTQFLFRLFLFCSDLFTLKLRGHYHPNSEGTHPFLFRWFLFCWVTQFLFCSFLFCSDLFALKLGGGSPHFKVQRSQPIFILLIFIPLGHIIFVPLIFIPLWPFCT